MAKSMSLAEIIRLRNDLGGNTLLALVSGTRNRHDAERWTSGELVPDSGQIERFAVAREIFDRVAAQDGAGTARMIFQGQNTIVGNKCVTLIMAIRYGHFNAARTAAQKSLDSEWI